MCGHHGKIIIMVLSFSPPFWAYGSGGYFLFILHMFVWNSSLFSPTLLVLEMEFTLIKAWQQALFPYEPRCWPYVFRVRVSVNFLG